MRRPHRPLTKEEFARFQRREAALEQIAQAFHGEVLANWRHIAGLVFSEMKEHCGIEFVQEFWPQLKERYGEKIARRMLPEIISITGDDEARRIFGKFGPLSPRERQKHVVDNAFITRYLNMPTRNKARLISEKLEENKNLPPHMRKGIGGVEPATLEHHLRDLLKDFPAETSNLKVVKKRESDTT
jgi:hypothetical protein